MNAGGQIKGLGESIAGMNNLWSKVERIWNENRSLAWVLALCVAGLALWAIFKPQSPGVSIGLLALAAGIMSVRPKMHTAEKMTWVVFLIVFAILEIHAINKSDEYNRTTREQQNSQFAEIARGLQQSIITSKQQYESTIGQVQGVLQTTESVASLARDNLNNVTGGHSYAYLVPEPVEGATGYSVNLFNNGDEVLTGLTVRIGRVRGERKQPEQYWIDSGPMHAIPMYTLASHAHALVSDYWIVPLEDGVLTKHFIAIITAQNGDVLEDIYFRPASHGTAFAFRFTVKQLVRLGKIDSPGSHRTDEYKILKTVDWTEPKPL